MTGRECSRAPFVSRVPENFSPLVAQAVKGEINPFTSLSLGSLTCGIGGALLLCVDVKQPWAWCHVGRELWASLESWLLVLTLLSSPWSSLLVLAWRARRPSGSSI